MKKALLVFVLTIAMLSLSLAACSKTHSHNAENLIPHQEIAATCEKDGMKQYWSCRECDKLFADEGATQEITEDELKIPAIGHKYPDDWTIVRDATCKEAGLKQKVCENDDSHVLSEAITKLPHTLVDVPGKEATCEEEGLLAHKKCSVCDTIVLADGTEGTEDDVVIPAAHVFDEAHHHQKQDETCTEDGAMEYYECVKCGRYFKDDKAREEIVDKNVVIPAAHVFDTEHYHPLVPADCEAPGTVEYYECARCGKYFEVNESGEKVEIVDKNVTIPAKGHDIDKSIYDFDENQHWYRVNCGHTDLPDDVIGRGNHEMVGDVCSVCGYETFTNGISFAEDGEAYRVTGYSGSSKRITIPATYRRKPVTKIGTEAFVQKDIESVVIPDSVTEIGLRAFDQCEQLNTVKMSSNLKVLGSSAFGNCKALTELTLPATLETVGEYAFYLSGLTKIYYSSTVAMFNERNFAESFTTTYPGTPSTTVIYFYDENKEETEEGHYFRNGAGGREEWEITATQAYTRGLTFEQVGQAYTVTGYTGTAADIVIPWTYSGFPVTAIKDHAFVDYDAESGTITSSKSLHSLVLGGNVQSIGESAFSGCGLTELELNEGLLTIGKGAFESCPIENFELPASVQSIGENAFKGARITQLTISENTTQIGAQAFAGTLIETLLLGKNAALGVGAFDTCPLRKVYYGGGKADWENVKGENEFLSSILYFFSVDLPTDEGNYWHYVGEDVVEWPFISQEEFTSDLNFIANEAEGTYSVGKYMGAETEIVIPSLYNRRPVVKIENEAFKDLPITSVKLGDNVSVIGDEAFAGTNLTNFNTVNVATIGNAAFGNCTQLEWIVFGKMTAELSDPFDGITPTVFYEDSEQHWADVAQGEAALEGVYFYAAIQPYTEGNFWHYEGEIPTPYDSFELGADDEFTQGLTFTTDDESAYFVSGYTGSELDVIIPSVYQGKPVTKVLASAFSGKSITSIKFGKYISVIEKNAFKNCRSLASMEISTGVLEIGEAAFSGCTSLTNVKIASADLTIGLDAFSGCMSMNDLTLTGRIVSIGSDAFADCRALNKDTGGRFVYVGTLADWCAISFENADANPLSQSGKMILGEEEIIDLVIPRGVTKVNDFAFYGASALKSITIGYDVASVGKMAFRNLGSVSNIVIEGKVLTFGANAFYGTNVQNVYLNCSVTEWVSAVFENESANPLNGASLYMGNDYISTLSVDASVGDYAFYGCESLIEVVLGDGVLSVGKGAFMQCRSLNKITVSTSVESFGENAFDGCSLRDVYYSAQDISGWMAIDFANASATPLYCNHTGGTCTHNLYCGEDLVTEVSTGELTKVGRYAFGGCTSIETVVLTDSVNEIGVGAFSGCRNISYTEDGNGRYLGTADNDKYALMSVIDRSVTSFIMGDTTQIIADMAFSGCSDLFSLMVGAEFRYVSDKAFDGISLLTVFYGGNSEDWGAIDGSETGKAVLTQAALYYFSNEDIGDEGWHYVNDEPIPYGTKGLVYTQEGEAYTVTGYTGKEALVVIPATHLRLPVTKIGASAFKDPDQFPSQSYGFITRVVIGDNVVSIGKEAFYRSKIVSVSGGKSLQEIGQSAFGAFTSGSGAGNVSALESFEFGEELLTIAKNAFKGQPLKEVKFGSKLQTIGDGAFQTCTQIKEVRIPDSVTSLGSSVFSGCTGIVTLIIGDGLEVIPDKAFNGCTGINTLVIGTKVNKVATSGPSTEAFLNVNVAEVYYKGETRDGFDAIENLGLCRGIPSIPILYSSVYKAGCWHYNGENMPELWDASAEG